MCTKSFRQWLEWNAYAWNCKFRDIDEILEVIQKYTSRGTRIGKVLTKLKIECNSYTIQLGVIAWNAEHYTDKIKFLSDPTEIQRCYEQVRSCMTKNADKMGEFLGHSLLVEQGIRLAVYQHHGRITGRCIVDINSKKYLHLYTEGNDIEFYTGLTELGYEENHNNLRMLGNKRLPIIEGFRPYLDGFEGYHYFAKLDDADWYIAIPGGCAELIQNLSIRILLCGVPETDIHKFKVCIDRSKDWNDLTWESPETILKRYQWRLSDAYPQRHYFEVVNHCD